MRKLILAAMTLILSATGSWAQQQQQRNQNAAMQQYARMMRNVSRVETKSIHSEILNADREYCIYLPAGYDNNPDRSYPILYLLHGMDGTNTSWFELGHLKDIMDQLRSAGEVCDMIVVSPNAGGKIQEGYWNGYFDMEGWAYERFFYEEFLPTIEKEYRVKADKAHRAVAGLSMGGGGCTAYAQRHSDMYCACYAMSALMHLPAPQANPKEKTKMWYLTEAANRYSCVEFVQNADDATKQALRTVAWYVDCGDDDFLFDCNIDFINAMRKAGIPYQLRIRDGVHNWEYWRTALYTALPFVSRNFGK